MVHVQNASVAVTAVENIGRLKRVAFVALSLYDAVYCGVPFNMH